MAKKRTVDSGKLKGVMQQLNQPLYKDMVNQLGRTLVGELKVTLTNPLRRPFINLNINVEEYSKKYLRARQKGNNHGILERQVGRSDNQAVAVQLNDQLLNEVSNLQDKLSSAGCPKDTEHPWFQRELAEQFLRGVDDALRQHIELELRKK